MAQDSCRGLEPSEKPNNGPFLPLLYPHPTDERKTRVEATEREVL